MQVCILMEILEDKSLNLYYKLLKILLLCNFQSFFQLFVLKMFEINMI